MRNTILFLLVICIISSCINSNKNLKEGSSVDKIKKQAIRIAETYANGQLKEAKKSVSKDGLVVLSDSLTKCLIDPSRIVIGEIDDDTKKDAIVPLYILRDQTLVLTEHLILINRDGKFIIARVLDSEMKILSIKDRVIYAEISKLASDSPFSGCQTCKEIVKYQFRGDSLTIIK